MSTAPHAAGEPQVGAGHAQPGAEAGNVAAALAEAQVGQQMVARPYREWYTDNTKDPFVGNYPAMYANYDLIQPPQSVRNQIYPNGNNGVPINHALVVLPPDAPAGEPGTIQGYHRVTRYQPSLVGTTPFDNVAYAFLGDVRRGQAPHTVVWDDTYFNRAAVVQVPTAANLDQLLAADPNAQLVGPFAAGDADTEALTVRNAVFVPNRYMVMLLDDHMTPRQAWQSLRGAILTDGLAEECAPLIDWLRVALTRHGIEQSSVVAQAPPVMQTIATVDQANLFQAYRMGFVERDHPDLRAGPMARGAQLIAGGLNDLATQSRLTRQSDEQRRQREQNKTAQDLFPAGLQKLMRWCNAQTEDMLPPIYTELARTKKGSRRAMIQVAVNNAMELLGYQQDFPITTKMANRVVDLEWAHQLTDDLSLGLQIFTLGWLSAADTEDVKRLNTVADAMFSGMSAPSVTDASAILDSNDDVRIPRTLAHLRYSVEHVHAFWHVHLGPGHPLTARLSEYHRHLIAQEAALELVTPRHRVPKSWTPALLARRIQIDCQVWMTEQGRSDYPIPVPRLVDVFGEIARKKDWAPDLPAAYFQLEPEARPSSAEQSVVAVTSGEDLSTISGRTPTLATDSTSSSTPIQRAIRNPAPEAAYDEFAALGLKTSKVKDYCASHNITWPMVRRNVKFCASYDIKHMCNTRCGAVDDHHPHTAEETQRMVEWCRENYKVE